jgi:hypothetical protein
MTNRERIAIKALIPVAAVTDPPTDCNGNPK